mgnify:CR=1 FL=1
MEHRVAASKEHNTQPQGRSGSETPKKKGPIGSPAKNPTKDGGVNRATQGSGG